MIFLFNIKFDVLIRLNNTLFWISRTDHWSVINHVGLFVFIQLMFAKYNFFVASFICESNLIWEMFSQYCNSIHFLSDCDVWKYVKTLQFRFMAVFKNNHLSILALRWHFDPKLGNNRINTFLRYNIYVNHRIWFCEINDRK